MVRVISFHYVLKDESGKKLDSSRETEPMVYLEGSGQIIPGLEAALGSMKTGEKSSIRVNADQAYGQPDKELIFDVPRAQFPKTEKIEIGMRFRAGSPDAPEGEDEHSPVFVVKHVTAESVSVDGNHPLAGMDLFFDVEILDVREPTADELKHGHAHGPDGHGHHHHH